MDLRALVALAGIVTPELLNRIESSAEVEEADGAGFDRATTRPEEEVMDDPMQSMGSNADLSLRRYLKAKGDHVTVDETVYPDYSVKDVNEAYTSFKESKERPYVAVHVKKGKTDVTGSSSYEAAKKAAAKWGLKSTAGVDVHLADVTHTPTESLAEAEQPDPMAIIRQRTTELARKANVSMKNVNFDKVYKFIEQRKSLGKGAINQQPEKIGKLIEYYQNMASKANPNYNDRVMDLIYDSIVEMVDEVAPMIHSKNEAKDYGPGKIGAVQKMLDKERDAKKATDDDRDELTKKLFPKRSRADMEKSDRERNRAMNAKRFMKSGKPSRSREWGAYEGVNEAEEGTYMKQWYNYSESFAMLELYVDGKLVDEWNDYFGANETGNPLQAKFIEMAKENGVDPVGLKVIDGEDGDEGVFTSSGLKWNSNDTTESLNDIKKLAGIAEADLDENAFNQAAAAAARAGKDSFEFNGKTYKTKMDKSTAHKLDDDVDMLRKLAGLAQ